MQPLLQNLVEMTALRDHLRLEISVVSTLLRLSGVIKVRALEIFATSSGERLVRPRTYSQGSKVLSNDIDGSLDPLKTGLQALSALGKGLQQNASRAGAAVFQAPPGCDRGHFRRLPQLPESA